MKVIFLTIVKDGMPWITRHWPVFRTLPFAWEWHIVEGTAGNLHCTNWCQPQQPGLSTDGTREYLDQLTGGKTLIAGLNPNVTLHRLEWWPGKVAMLNAALRSVAQYQREPFLLWQVDADELWSAAQITRLRQMFLDHPERNAAYFWCRYFVGPDIIITTCNTYGNNSSYEWHRVWRVMHPGQLFERHEPPVLRDFKEVPFTNTETFAAGLVFDHMAYATRAQVEFKEKFYGYANATAEWDRLQQNTRWPVRLRDFLSWVDGEAMAARVHHRGHGETRREEDECFG